MLMKHDLYVIQLNVIFRVFNNFKLNFRCVPSVDGNTWKKILEILTFISTAMTSDKFTKATGDAIFFKYVTDVNKL